jgi:salicylate hydroxylase
MKISRISIIGGGIGGLSAALALQHFGHRVSVFEQAGNFERLGQV